MEMKGNVTSGWITNLLQREVDSRWKSHFTQRLFGPLIVKPKVFVDPVLALAAIDQIFDRSKVAVFKGKSYRAERKNKVRVPKRNEMTFLLGPWW